MTKYKWCVIFSNWQQLTGNRFRFYRGRKVRTAQSGKSFSALSTQWRRERRILRTICRRKESATESKPPDLSGKGEKVGQEPTGRNARAAPHRQTPSAARPNRERAVARSVISSGFWSHRQMIAAGDRPRNRIRLISNAASV